MKRCGLRVRIAATLAFAWGLASIGIAQAGTVRGTVKNGTTGQMAAGIELVLLQPIKGAVVGIQWALRMHGFDELSPEP